MMPETTLVVYWYPSMGALGSLFGNDPSAPGYVVATAMGKRTGDRRFESTCKWTLALSLKSLAASRAQGVIAADVPWPNLHPPDFITRAARSKSDAGRVALGRPAHPPDSCCPPPPRVTGALIRGIWTALT
jgi:hypothetical protein